MAIPAIILAGGASRRLGQPKQLVRIEGETLLARTIRVVREASADPIFVVLGANLEGILANVDISEVRPVINPDWEQGIASSIHAGLNALLQDAPDATAAMLLVCDQPSLTREHLGKLVRAYIGGDQSTAQVAIVASSYAGVAGIPAIFPRGQFPKLLALSGDAGAKYLLRNPECALVIEPFEGGEIDLDTPFDLAAMRLPS